MAKVITIFTTVICPICGDKVDRKLNSHALAEHIQSQHPAVQLRPVVKMLFARLELGLPDNISEISRDELLNLLENMAQYEATTLGLKRLRHSSLPK